MRKLFQKFVCAFTAVAIAVTSLVIVAGAEDLKPLEESPLTISSTPSNYTTYDISVKVDASGEIDDTGMALSEYESVLISFYFNDCVTCNNKSSYSNTHKFTDTNDYSIGFKANLTDVPEKNATSLQIIEKVVIKATKNDNTNVTVSYEGGNSSFSLIDDIEGGAAWISSSSVKSTVRSSCYATINGVSINEMKSVTVTAVPSDYFTFNTSSFKAFSGLTNSVKDKLVWTFVPYAVSNKYSPAGNGIYVTLNAKSTDFLMDGELPIYKSFTVEGTDNDGTVYTEQLTIPTVKINDFSLDFDGGWTNDECTKYDLDISADDIRNIVNGVTGPTGYYKSANLTVHLADGFTLDGETDTDIQISADNIDQNVYQITKTLSYSGAAADNIPVISSVDVTGITDKDYMIDKTINPTLSTGKLPSFTVEFIDGDAADTKTVGFGEKVTALTPNTAESDNFLGWFNGETEFDFDTVIKSNITLTAKYETKTFVVTFINGSSTSEVTVKYGNKVSPSTVADIYGYTFEGWYDGDEAFDFDTAVKSDYTLTAVFDPIIYTVTFVNNGESVERKYPYNSIIEPLEIEQEEGEVFLGWYKDGELFDFLKENVSENITLTAVYEKDVCEATFIDGDTISNGYFDYGTVIKAPVPNAPVGMEFTGWVDDGGNAFDFDTVITGDITLTATYAPNKYSVTITNGLTALEDSVEYGTQLNEPVADDIEGYTFEEWVDADGNTVRFPITVTSDIVISAVYTENPDGDVIEIPGGDTPLADKPNDNDNPSGGETIIIGGNDTPLSDGADIGDSESANPSTGVASAGIVLYAAIAAGTVAFKSRKNNS